MRLWLVLLAVSAVAADVPDGVTFYASFDKLSANADFALGDPASTFTANLELRPAEGIRGNGLLQQLGERCGYAIKGNLETRQGTISLWVKPLNWSGEDRKFRHFFTAVPSQKDNFYLYLYPIGDEQILWYVRQHGREPNESISKAGGPPDLLQKGEWTHLAATWDDAEMRLYLNGQRIGQGLPAQPVPKFETGEFQICPIQFWKNAQWSDPDEQTICDEFRIFDRPLRDDEVLDLYAHDVPGGLASLKPEMAIRAVPRYDRHEIDLTVKPAHLDDAWRAKLDGAAMVVTATDPTGRKLLDQSGPLGDGERTVKVPAWADGDYLVTAELTAHDGAKLSGEKTLTKPPTPWLKETRDWRADRVLEPWRPLQRKGDRIDYWAGRVTLNGPFPATQTHHDGPLLAAPINLTSGEQAATWSAAKIVEEVPQRVTGEGTGKLGDLTLSYRTTMEFDGLVRCDLTLTPPAGGAKLSDLELAIPVRRDVATWYRNPRNEPWDGQHLEELRFKPYGWLGNQQRGLSWFMESDANWVRAESDPTVTIDGDGDTATVQLHWVSQEVEVTNPLTYTVGFAATPVKPGPTDLYEHFLSSGPQFKGCNEFVFGWGQQISTLNGRLIAVDPEDQRKLVDKWRAKGIESLDYSCTQCTADISPEYLFFGPEWSQPYGASFSGYKRRGDDAPYTMTGVCPQSSFSDFLAWCARENVSHDWSGGIYTDIDGLTACDNTLHGCGGTDLFGRQIRTYPIYAHRRLSRLIYAACHDYGKLYYAHAHNYWVAPYHAFTDGWCPGEQYSSQVVGKPTFYMDEIPDRVWRSEYDSRVTGVPTFLLAQYGRLTKPELKDEPGPTESLFAAALTYGVPLWVGGANKEVTEAVWAVQQAFGMKGTVFSGFWEQSEFKASDPDVRVSVWSKAGQRLLMVSNFTAAEKPVTVSGPEGCRLKVVWPTAAEVSSDKLELALPAKRGVLVEVTGLSE